MRRKVLRVVGIVVAAVVVLHVALFVYVAANPLSGAGGGPPRLEGTIRVVASNGQRESQGHAVAITRTAVATCFHTLEGHSKVTLVLPDGTEVVPSGVIALDAERDYVVFALPTPLPESLVDPVVPVDELKPGARVVLGRGDLSGGGDDRLGFLLSVREWPGSIMRVETSCESEDGQSGGPIRNANGGLVGMHAEQHFHTSFGVMSAELLRVAVGEAVPMPARFEWPGDAAAQRKRRRLVELTFDPAAGGVAEKDPHAFEEAYADVSSDWVFLFKYARVLQDAGEHVKAEAMMREAIAVWPESAFTWAWLGHALLKQGKLDEANVAADRAISVLPEFPTGEWHSVAVLLDTLKRFEESPKYALGCFDAGIARESAIFLAVQGYQFSKRYDQASALAALQLELYPSDENRLTMAGIEYMQRRYVRAREWAAAVLRRDPTNETARKLYEDCEKRLRESGLVVGPG